MIYDSPNFQPPIPPISASNRQFIGHFSAPCSSLFEQFTIRERYYRRKRARHYRTNGTTGRFPRGITATASHCASSRQRPSSLLLCSHLHQALRARCTCSNTHPGQAPVAAARIVSTPDHHRAPSLIDSSSRAAARPRPRSPPAPASASLARPRSRASPLRCPGPHRAPLHRYSSSPRPSRVSARLCIAPSLPPAPSTTSTSTTTVARYGIEAPHQTVGPGPFLTQLAPQARPGPRPPPRAPCASSPLQLRIRRSSST